MPRNDFINVDGTINYDNIASTNALTQSGTQSINAQSINVKYPTSPLSPAIGDNVTDDGVAIQNIINYAMQYGKNVYFPAGVYKIGSTLLMDRNISGKQERTSLCGDSAGLSILNYTGTGTLLDIKGTLSASQMFGTQGLNSYQNFSDLYLNGNNYLGTGIHTINNSTLKFTNIKIMGFDTGMYMQDIESSDFEDVNVSWCNKGMIFEQQSPPIALSTRPNNLNFYGCAVGSCLQYGIYVKGGTLFNWFGGMIANNGYNNPTNMSNTSWGIKIEDSCYQGGVACNLQGIYFEDNAGIADVWLINQANNVPVITDSAYNINGCSFNRGSIGYYSRNNICCTFAAVSTTGKQKLCLVGCSFKIYNTYVADASRKNINYDGAVQFTTKDNFESIGCIFQSNVEGLSVDVIAKPFFEAANGTAQSIPTATWTTWAINTTLNSKNWNTILDTTNHNMPIPENGVYSISANVIFTASATGKRGIRLVHSIYGVIANIYSTSDSLDFNLSISTAKKISTGETIHVDVYQDSGAALSVKGADLTYTYLNITKIEDN